MLVGVDRLIDIDRVTVVTDGAAPRLEKRRLKLQKGQRSRPIHLQSRWTVVRHVDLSYRLHLGAAGPANVELWGLRVRWESPRIAAPNPRRGGRPGERSTAGDRERPPRRGGRETDGDGAVLFGVQEVGTAADRTSSNSVGNTASLQGFGCGRSAAPSEHRNAA